MFRLRSSSHLVAHLVGVGHKLWGHVWQRAAEVPARDKRLELVLAEPKVCHFDVQVLAVPVHKQVVWLEVKVNDGGVLRVEEGHSPAGLDRHLAPLLERGTALSSPE